MAYREVVVLPDIHWEHHNVRALSSATNYIACLSNPLVGVIGDFYTLDEFSRFRKDPRQANRTLRSVETAVKDFWKPLRGMTTDLWYTLGNHEERIYDYLIDRAPDILSLTGVPYEDWLGFGPYVDRWCHYEDGLKFGNVVFTHGNRTGTTSAKGLLEGWGMSGMSGHTHQAKRHEKRTGNGRLMWQEVGFLGDMRQWYNDHNTTDWHTGFGHAWIDDRGKELPQMEFVRVDEKSGRFTLDGVEWRP